MYDANPGEGAAYANGRDDEREAIARLVAGEVFKEHYRVWPTLDWGNRANDSELVRFADALVAAIRARGHR